MSFICHHNGKELSRQRRLKSYIDHFHRREAGEQCLDEEPSTPICPEKYCSADMPGVAGFSGSPPYITPLERNQESQWTEKNADVDASVKKTKKKSSNVIDINDTQFDSKYTVRYDNETWYFN